LIVLFSVKIPATTIAALAGALSYGAGFWLVLLHRAEGGREHAEPGLLLHTFRDGTLALPGVLAAVWLGGTLALGLVDRRRRLAPGWRGALLAGGGAAAGAVVLAAGNPLHALLFSTTEAHALSPALHLGRDALFAFTVCLPIAGAVVALTRLQPLRLLRSGRRAAHPEPAAVPAPVRAAAPVAVTPAPAAVAPRRGLTRRGFVAGGLASAGAAGVVLTRSSHPARAQEITDRLVLYINDGHVPMVDGTMVYMRGYGGSPAGDPAPSLAIEPQLFLNGHIGPVPGRTFPLVDPSRIPEDGSPSAAGIDPSGAALHHIRRRHWASFFPRRVIVAETGSQIRLRITNRLAEPHTFTIAGVVDMTLGPAGSATATRDIDFPAPAAGTYVYHDTTNAPVNRVLGLFGVLVVVPADAPWTLDGSEGEFERQFVWIFHDIDPEWGRRARLGTPIDPVRTPSLPRYFTINDRSGVFAAGVSPDEAENHRTHEDTKPSGHGRRVNVRNFSDPAFGTGQLLRIVNTGIAIHQPHFHGNHVWTIAVDNEVLSRSSPKISPDGHILMQLWEDVVEIDPLQTKAVMLPVKPPSDALQVVLENQQCDYAYPMHCHAEMSQTAGGGLYPGGMVTDWTLKP
jgi:FtsP/CotA-like multicopper oxidase with cupredoxin domain